jgi:hypothetical protein
MIPPIWYGRQNQAGFEIHAAFFTSLEVCTVIHFLWLKNLPVPEIFYKIDSIYWTGVIKLRVIQEWTHRSEEGDHSLEDEPRLGCLRSTEHVDAICALLVNHPYISQKRIVYILSIHQSTVKGVLHKDFLLWTVNFKWIPHRLDNDQKLKRFRLTTELLAFLDLKSECPLANIYTRDEM